MVTDVCAFDVLICRADSKTGDQVSKKGGMTGGFYDYRRSKLKFMNIIMRNTKTINAREEEVEKVRYKLQDILCFRHSFSVIHLLSLPFFLSLSRTHACVPSCMNTHVCTHTKIDKYSNAYTDIAVCFLV